MRHSKNPRWSMKRLERWANRLIEGRKKKPVRSSFNLESHMRKRERQLRRSMTPHERLIQNLLRKLSVAFSAQHGFIDGGTIYVVDFFLPDPLNLVIEVDGVSHESVKQRKKDATRDGFFAGNHFRVIRITNDEAQTLTANALRHLIADEPLCQEDPAEQFRRFA